MGEKKRVLDGSSASFLHPYQPYFVTLSPKMITDTNKEKNEQKSFKDLQRDDSF